jgi:flavin reductase (DIM6/NTAB) family NADH-FMN oxidoreductase RutF
MQALLHPTPVSASAGLAPAPAFGFAGAGASPPALQMLEATQPDSRTLRSCLGQMATGVTVIATRAADGTLLGLTANSFSALSLDPPLIVWSLRLASSSLPVFQAAPRFVVNILAEAQTDISRRFASQTEDKFDGLAYALNEHQLPLLHSAAAWFECRTMSQQTVGDHCLFVAQVERCTSSEAAPLLFHAGGYYGLGSRL